VQANKAYWFTFEMATKDDKNIRRYEERHIQIENDMQMSY